MDQIASWCLLYVTRIFYTQKCLLLGIDHASWLGDTQVQSTRFTFVTHVFPRSSIHICALLSCSHTHTHTHTGWAHIIIYRRQPLVCACCFPSTAQHNIICDVWVYRIYIWSECVCLCVFVVSVAVLCLMMFCSVVPTNKPLVWFLYSLSVDNRASLWKARWSEEECASVRTQFYAEVCFSLPSEGSFSR